MITLKEIEVFFKDYKFKENTLILSNHEKITDLKNFVEVNIHILKNNSGKALFVPYFDRLKKVYLTLNKKK
jgi:hypothetical protein